MRDRIVAFAAATLLLGSCAAAPARQNPELENRLSLWMRRDMPSGSAHGIMRQLAIPGRLSGSPEATEAVRRSKKLMLELGFANVRLEPVKVPVWVRKSESAKIVINGAPPEELRIAALGGSAATPPGGIQGEIIEINSWDDVAALGERAKGKIIFYNRAMDPRSPEPFSAYGAAVDQRSRGGYEATKAGAIAAIVRSMTTRLDNNPHTGAMRAFMDDQITPVVPTAAVSTLGAERLHSLLKSGRGPVQLQLTLDCGFREEADSHNVVGEIVGYERPEEIVLIGGHLDAWDLGDGAHDDAAGCAHTIEALRLIKSAGIRPKRTIRAVMFMNEENGLRGGRAYAEAHANEKHFFAIESDRGGFDPRGFACVPVEPFFSKLGEIVKLLEPLGCGKLQKGGGGADLSVLQKNGVVCAELIPDARYYFDYHHSALDTIDAVDPDALQRGAIALAFVISAVADM
ncbi:MAG: M20/M25/M40 family metallo-hydrolase [Planctomycetota bacterium]